MSDIFGFPEGQEEPTGQYFTDEEWDIFNSYDWGETRYTLYGDGDHAGESWTMTGQEWVGEAYLSQWKLLKLYGLDNLDIIEGLIDAGYDYGEYSEITGKWISGLWADWREFYGETA